MGIFTFNYRQCDYCSEIFMPINPSQHYCSFQCRLWDKIKVIKDESSCWEWQRFIDLKTNAYILYEGKSRIVSRLIYELTYGEIADKNLLVCHTCCNVKCCRPSHLALGTRKEKMADMMAKGRARVEHLFLKGQDHTQSKLADNQILQIRQMEGKYKDIAKQFGISRSQIGHIKNNKNWNHL